MRLSRIGLYDGREPSQENIEEQIKRAGELLGAIAFHLFDLHSDNRRPEPETGSVSRDLIKPKLVRSFQSGWGGVRDTEHDIIRLEKMNSRHLEFLLFRELNERHFRFHDRTVHAFFAAHWASKFPVDTQRMKGWANNDAYAEFWQFTVDLPDVLVEPDCSCATFFESCYVSPPEISGDQNYVQWIRWTVYKSYSKYCAGTRDHRQVAGTGGHSTPSRIRIIGHTGGKVAPVG